MHLILKRYVTLRSFFFKVFKKDFMIHKAINNIRFPPLNKKKKCNTQSHSYIEHHHLFGQVPMPKLSPRHTKECNPALVASVASHQIRTIWVYIRPP